MKLRWLEEEVFKLQRYFMILFLFSTVKDVITTDTQFHNPVQDLDQKCKLLDLSQLFVGWDYYTLDQEANNENNELTLEHGSLFSSDCLNKKSDRTICFKVVKNLVNKYSFIDGKICLTTLPGSEDHNKITTSSKTFFNLFIPFPWRDQYVNIKQIISNNRTSVECINVPENTVRLQKDGTLYINKNVLHEPIKSIKCYLKRNGSNSKFKLIIQFENDFEVLVRRRRNIPIYFEKSLYSVDIFEDTKRDSVIRKLKVNGGSGKYSFSKTEDPKTDILFKVKSDTGDVILLQELNREDGAERFSIDIRAIDLNDPSNSATTTIRVKVLDVNDNAPTFAESSYSITVDEGQVANKYILTVRATDADEGSNQEIRYSIVNKANVQVPFQIDPISGAIKSTDVLDRETHPYYNFTVRAEDQGKVKLHTDVSVSITLRDKNDNSPKFSKDVYKLSIPENTTVGSVVFKLDAVDDDIGQNGVIEFRPLDSNLRFRINTSTGEIILKEAVDFDKYQRFSRFTVVAFDKGSPPKYANTEVEITIEDVNDNAPRFAKRIFERTSDIMEDIKVGSFVYKLSARDRDSGPNGDITFKLEDGLPQDFPFELDPKSGEITVSKGLDYETTKSYKFGVIAVDNGHPPKKDTTQVVFNIGNVNDNNPKFKQSSYYKEILEDTRRGEAIEKVEAFDPDQLSNEDFEYAIEEGNSDDCFGIDPFQGVLFLKCDLDYKRKNMYNLKLRVTDADKKPGYAYFKIEVTDANNNSPRFGQDVYQWNVLENADIGTVIKSVLATDADTGENARITYSLQPGSPIDTFGIVNDTGAITTKKKLDRETTKSYTLVVKASDHGKPFKKFGFATVVITVTDVNDNKPAFTKNLYTFTIEEDAKIGAVVGHLQATDNDEGRNKEVRYQFKERKHEYFSINAESGSIRTIKLLDRETIERFTFEVLAIDQGTPALQTSTSVIIDIEDVQDSNPVFTEKVYNFTIPENSLVEVGRIRATLADDAFRHSMVYSFTKYQTTFRIASLQGIIRANSPLDYEKQHHYQLHVRVVSDSGREDTAVVNVHVEDVNDHPPILEDFYIFLNALNGKYDPMFRVPAEDPDVSSVLRYGIITGNEHDFISLNDETGELFLKKSIINTAAEIEILFEVSDGKYADRAYGHILVSEVTDVMVKNSMFIVLNNATRNDFLKATVLRKFKDSLAQIFDVDGSKIVDASKIFILSIEAFRDPRKGNKNAEMLEIAIAVKSKMADTYMTADFLKDKFYLNATAFTRSGFDLVSFDFWGEYFCGSESCKNLERCSIQWSNTNQISSTIKSKYVIFRGIYFKPTLKCECPHRFHGMKCDKPFNMCFMERCNSNGKCISTDDGFSCKCDHGYTGDFCAFDRQTSSCPIQLNLAKNPCGLRGACSAKSGGGFDCTCPAKGTDTEYCKLSTRYFPKGSYIAMPGLKKQQRNFDISFQFRTFQANAVLLYNGRYSNQNDFIAVEIVDGQVVFSVNFGKSKDNKEQVTTVQSFNAGGVNDGKWHTVKVQLKNKVISIAVGESCDIETASVLNSQGTHRYCAASTRVQGEMKTLDLTAPALIGGLPDMQRTFISPVKDFIGCMRNIVFDHNSLDLSNYLHNFGSAANCPAPEPSCNDAYCTKYVNGDCHETFDGPKCSCRSRFVGQRCEKAAEPIRLNANSVLVVDDSQASGSGFSAWRYSMVVKTTQKDAVILEETINGVDGRLMLKNGYLQYHHKSKLILVLDSFFMANGKWNQIQIKWTANRLYLSSLYDQHSVSTPLPLTTLSLKMTSFGGTGNNKLLACIKAFTYNDNDINLLHTSNKHVQKGCLESSLCDTLDCGTGTCQITSGVAQCHCNGAGYKGPQCVDICKDSPCNTGTCKHSSSSLSGYVCDCPIGFTGEHCEIAKQKKCPPKTFGKDYCGPCDCKLHENFNETCDPDGQMEPYSYPGKCFCNDDYYLKGGTCVKCNCLLEGSESSVCDKKTGQCKCKANVIGMKCDKCPGAWQEITNGCGEINNSCPRTYVDGIWWRRAARGVTQRERCPFNAVGNATRHCDPRKGWQPPDFFDCTSQLFSNIQTLLKPVLTSGKRMTKDLVTSISYKLDFAVSAPKLTFTPHAFYGKDIMIGYDALRLMISYEGNQTADHLVSADEEQFVGNLLKSAGKLFQTSLSPFWDSIQKKYSGTAGLMKEMERFVNILSKNLAYIKRNRNRRSVTLNTYSQATSNIYFEIKPMVRGNSVDEEKFITLPDSLSPRHIDYYMWKDPSVSVRISDAIFLDHDELFRINEVNIGLIIYKTLGHLLPTNFDQDNREEGRKYALNVYSDVVTLTIPSIKSLHPLTEIQITYKNVSQLNSTSTSLVCAFWNYSLSGTVSGGWSPNGCVTKMEVNSSDVTCVCNRMASFALVGFQYTEIIPRVYQPAFLVYIALAVAMLLFLIVFLVFLCLSQLKSNANSIHKNLAFVLLLGWIVFTFAINRPDVGKANCRIIAILIHYCLTCAFSWLMVEALHMYRMILEPRDINYGQMMFYYFIGWGAPVIVVGVTAGLKPDGYGTPEFCWISAKVNDSVWTYVAPIFAIIAGTFIIIILALASSCEKANIKGKKAKLARIRYRLAISFFFLFIMMVTVFGGLLEVSFDMTLLTYIFAGTCALEGVYMFLFYVCFNRKVRREAYNAYKRYSTGNKSYGLKPPPKRRGHRFGEKEALIGVNKQYAHVFEAFHLDSTSSNESSDTTDGRRRARAKFAMSDTSTDFQTHDSSDSSDDDSTTTGPRKRPADSDSDSSDDNSSGMDEFSTPTTTTGNGSTPMGGVEWKQATSKKLALSRTYASDGPMHSTPSESEASERLKWKTGVTPKKSDLSAINSESDISRSEKRPVRKGPKGPTRISSSNTDSDTQSQSKAPVSILKKKSQYDSKGHRLRAVRVKDSQRKPLMSMNETADLNDSQV
uniref:Seven transmembrane protocadherin flamingo n=1 Tax=Clytia hemisphaerica TaxID=252671 RepID=I1YAR3_9CNID|nr:seven transmembrane protocadherin flamingo [Clytia hemisphaerica]